MGTVLATLLTNLKLYIGHLIATVTLVNRPIMLVSEVYLFSMMTPLHTNNPRKYSKFSTRQTLEASDIELCIDGKWT
jgi:hypothetical protein